MPLPPAHVYLDSADYSLLSNPRQRTDAVDKLRSELQGFVAQGTVKYVFSGANLSEMAPTASKHSPAATARADLLVEFCGKNAFISFDKLIRLELAKAVSSDNEPVNALSENATWFPELEDVISPIQWADSEREIDQEIRKRGVNRELRRKLRRQLFKAHQPTKKMRHWMHGQAESNDYTDILRLYPMRPEDAKMFGNYIHGTASKEDAEGAFLASLRDPRWMMRWFAAHSDKLTPITEWLRGPSKTMSENMRTMAEQVKKLRQIEALPGSPYRSDLLTRTGWKLAEDTLLENIANRLIAQSHESNPSAVDIQRIDKYCPGLSTMVRSLHGSLWDAVTENPREPMESDFVDAVHAMYAPYVDVFRADRYMAPHIRKQASRYDAIVVSKLAELPEAISDFLNDSRNKDA